MSDLETVRRAVTELRSLLDRVSDPFARTQIRLALDVLSNAVGRGAELTPALVSDIAFAFNDLHAGAADLFGDDAAVLAPLIEKIEQSVARMKAATVLPTEVIQQMRALQAKLKIRRSAIERQTYQEDAAAVALPHAPEDLRREAQTLQQHLAIAGFVTPALDALVVSPESVRFATIGDIIDELEVIADM